MGLKIIKKFMVSNYEKCIKFAKLCYETNKDEYIRRRQMNSSTIIQQIAQGKYAELLAANILINKGYDILVQPDFEIYGKEKKSFDADIVAYKSINSWDECNTQLVHVKSISKQSADMYGASWLFQKNDPMLSNPKSNDNMLFILLDSSGLEVDKYVILKASTVITKLKAPKIERLRSNKFAVYLNDLMEN